MRQAAGRNSCRINGEEMTWMKSHKSKPANDLKIQLTKNALSEMTVLATRYLQLYSKMKFVYCVLWRAFCAD